MKNVKLVNKLVGDNYPCYYVAEIGGSFQNFTESKRLIDSAIDIGIDAVKFQTLEAETITTKNNFFDMKATGKISQYDKFIGEIIAYVLSLSCQEMRFTCRLL